jgi:hypothetical protein
VAGTFVWFGWNLCLVSTDGGAFADGTIAVAYIPPTDDWDPYRERGPNQGGKAGPAYREITFFFHMWIQVNVPPEMRHEFNGAKEVRLQFRPGRLFGQESDHTIEGPKNWTYPSYPPFVWHEPTTPEADAVLIRRWQELAENEPEDGYNLIPWNCWSKTLWQSRTGLPPNPQPEFMKAMGEALEVHHTVTGGGIFSGGKF